MKDKKNKVSKILLSSTMVFAMAFSIMPTNVYAQENNATNSSREGDISIDKINFPDPYFREFIKNKDNKINTEEGNEGVLTQNEISAVTKIDIDQQFIESLKGIDCFIALTELSIKNARLLKSIDLSQNIALTSLEISMSNITSLDLSANKNLTKLIYQSNPITSLDLSANTALTYLDCGWNPYLKDINISKNTALTDLNCENCQIEKLDVSTNKDLTLLECGDNQLTSLDLSQNKDLTSLGCSYNTLTSLNVSQNKDLTLLECGDNQLTSLDLRQNKDLTFLGCYNNSLTILDVSENLALSELVCIDNQLTNLDVSKNKDLTSLDCGGNTITSLNVSQNKDLTHLDCGGNTITSLNVSQNKDLSFLGCYNNSLTILDVSENLALSELVCGNNQLTNLDVSKNSNLSYLECNTNQLTSLDLSKNTALTGLHCSSQTRTITHDESNGYLLSAYDAGFNKTKASDFVGATLESDGTLKGVTSDTPITYNYDVGNVNFTKKMDVSLTFTGTLPPTDSEKLDKAKPLAKSAIADIIATNDTTAGNILDTVKNSITSITGVTASWKSGSPIITKATNDKEGSITGTIILTSGSETVEVAVNKIINKIPLADDDKLAEAKPLAESSIKDMKVSNTTTDKDFLDAITKSISSVDGVKVSWETGSLIITKATSDKAGSITGTIVLTCGDKTIEITVNKIIDKLSSKTTIVDKTTGMEIEYEDGSSFADDIALVVTPKSKEEMKEFQDNVNKIVSDKFIAGVYDIKLLKNGVEIQPNGKLKIALTLTDAMKAMSDLQVVYIDDNGKVTIIPSQHVDGKLVFITDHFSYYGVIGKAISIDSIAPTNPTKPDNTETVKPTLPKTEDTSNGILYLGLIVLFGYLVGYGLKKKKELSK